MSDTEHDDFEQVKAYLKCSRRSAVSAEAYNPDDAKDDAPIVEHDKTKEQMKFLREMSRELLFFKTLEEEEREVVLKAMFEKKTSRNEILIREGDDGDNFYVIERGDFAISKEVSDGSSKVVAELHDKGFFGELSLLYNTPRSATVTSNSKGVVWGLDQKTFKKIIVGSTKKRRAQFESLLESIPMLNKLEYYERLNLADALDTRSYSDGQQIIKQGDDASELFFVMDGCVEIRVRSDESEVEKVVATSGPGKYFGELALVMKTKRNASVHAVGDAKCAALHVDAFERLLGPCKDIMERNIEVYDQEREKIGMAAVQREHTNGSIITNEKNNKNGNRVRRFFKSKCTRKVDKGRE